jgi:6-phosphogluconolactonase
VVDDVPAAFAALVVAEAPASIAFSGGTTAREAYEELAGRDLDWSGIHAWFGDERWVPVSDPESNEGMTRAALLDRVHPAAVHSMQGAGDTIEAAAAAYDGEVAAAPPIALVHLGLGPDGHTASLFPGSDSLAETHRWVIPAGDEEHPHPRLTFTFPAIAAARTVVVTVVGADKRDALAAVRARDARAPAARIDAAEVLWLVDPAALG